MIEHPSRSDRASYADDGDDQGPDHAKAHAMWQHVLIVHVADDRSSLDRLCR